MKTRLILPLLIICSAAAPGVNGLTGGAATVLAAQSRPTEDPAAQNRPTEGQTAQSRPTEDPAAQSRPTEDPAAQSRPTEGQTAQRQPPDVQPDSSLQSGGAPDSRSIQYSALPDLVKAYSPRVQMERTLYESRLNRYESAREEIMETRRLLREEADDFEKRGDADKAASYRTQAKTLYEAAKDMDKQIRSAKGSSSTMSLRRMEDTMLWTAQNLMGTYHSLRLEQQGAAARAEFLQSSYEKALSQASLGAVSQTEADEAGRTANEAFNKAQALKEHMERVRKELLMVTGYSMDSDVEIGSMPPPDPGRVEGYALDIDKWRAMGNNYDLRQQRSGSPGKTNKEVHAYQREINQGEETMYGQIDTLYQDVLANRTLWESACTAQAAREAQWKAASGKMQLGMMSRQEYLEARAAYLEGTAEKAQADVGFQQAMDAYDWAVKGLIVTDE